MAICPCVLMSAKSGAGDPSGGMDVAAQDADSVVVVKTTAPDVSATAAPRSRNPRRPNFLTW